MKQYKINNVTLNEDELRKPIKENPELKEEEDRWKPECGEKYWYISDEGYVFKTEEDAQKALERIEAINTVTLAIEELNEGWVPDWKNENEGKFYIFYNYEECVFITDYYLNTKDEMVLPYMKSADVADQIIKDYEAELKSIFKI